MKTLRFLWRHNRLGLFAGIVMLALVVVALMPQLFATHDPLQMSSERLTPPSSAFLFGTDRFGRDIQSRIAFGLQVSLGIGLTVTASAAVLGTVFGLTAGYFGGLADYLIMRLMDALFAFPSVLLALAIVATMGTGLVPVIVAITITFVPIFARVSRSPVLSVKEAEFVQAAYAIGVSSPRVLLRHILPNSLTPILVQAALSFSGAIVIEAAMGFLGLGIQPPTPSLGSILSEARTYMEVAPWNVVYPGLALGLLIMGVNLFGDAVRDVLDPRMRSL
jgi:peptide/nickel transport system permease protein